MFGVEVWNDEKRRVNMFGRNWIPIEFEGPESLEIRSTDIGGLHKVAPWPSLEDFFPHHIWTKSLIGYLKTKKATGSKEKRVWDRTNKWTRYVEAEASETKPLLQL